MLRKLAVTILVVAVMACGAVVAFAQGPMSSGVPFLGDRDGNRLSDDLDSRLAGLGDDATLPVIAVLTAAPSNEVMARLGNSAGAFVPKLTWHDALYGFSADLTKGQIQALSRDPLVSRIEYDLVSHACMDTAKAWTGVTQAWSDFGVTGDRDGNPTSYSTTDVVLAIIDTGIDTGHVDLDGGKVIGWVDLVNGLTTPYDDNGHGTHCSSITAGTGEGNPAYKGMAPGAALVGVKVLDRSGSATFSLCVDAINWVVANKDTYKIRAANYSIGADGSSDGTDAVSVAVNNAVSAGIVMCVAAGNAGPANYTIGTPAAAELAVTVGAMQDPGHNGWVIAKFSSRGPTADGRIKPDISAPGRYIMAAEAGSTNAYVDMSGTSMATPFCTGLVGLILDANYGLDVAGVKSVLYSNVKDFGPVGKDIDTGWGLCQPYSAVRQAGGFTGTWSDGLNLQLFAGYMPKSKATAYHYFTVTDTAKPVGITFIIPGWAGTNLNFDIYLLDPTGKQVESSYTQTRQETIACMPLMTGTYTLKVYSKQGAGDYWCSVSWK